jgi:hypothetical protein
MNPVKLKNRYPVTLLLLVLASLGLSGCNQDKGKDNNQYQVKLTNLTHNQPLSPLAVILHDPQFRAWQDGMPASDGIEKLAEGGDNSTLLDAEAGIQLNTATASGNGLILPGHTDSVTISTKRRSHIELTVASMLVNTNDAFTGINAVDVTNISVNQPLTLWLHALDAGTEANDELAANIPGPAGGGEGFNPSRADRDIITTHAGVISSDDGLPLSTLDSSHRFDNPVARVIITRTR